MLTVITRTYYVNSKRLKRKSFAVRLCYDRTWNEGRDSFSITSQNDYQQQFPSNFPNRNQYICSQTHQHLASLKPCIISLTRMNFVVAVLHPLVPPEHPKRKPTPRSLNSASDPRKGRYEIHSNSKYIQCL